MREKLFDLMMRDPCPSPVICDPNCKYYKSHHCHAERYADHLIANGVTVQDSKVVEIDQFKKWIPVTERLPEYGQQVIVYFGNLLSKQVMAYHFWSKDFDGWVNVTHWMPLPEPPKEGDPRE